MSVIISNRYHHGINIFINTINLYMALKLYSSIFIHKDTSQGKLHLFLYTYFDIALIYFSAELLIQQSLKYARDCYASISLYMFCDI